MSETLMHLRVLILHEELEIIKKHLESIELHKKELSRLIGMLTSEIVTLRSVITRQLIADFSKISVNKNFLSNFENTISEIEQYLKKNNLSKYIRGNIVDLEVNANCISTKIITELNELAVAIHETTRKLKHLKMNVSSIKKEMDRYFKLHLELVSMQDTLDELALKIEDVKKGLVVDPMICTEIVDQFIKIKNENIQRKLDIMSRILKA
jgi:hypothetical protein